MSVRTFTFNVVSNVTALEAAANGLAPGAYVDFAIPTWDQAWSQNGQTLTWSERFHWDAPRKCAHWFGKAQGGGQLRYVFYDAAANTFTQRFVGYPTAQTGGHDYDQSFIDSDGVAYWRPVFDTNVYRWNGTGWEVAFTHGMNNEILSFTWHPNLYGVGDGGAVIAGQNRLRTWRKSTGVVDAANIATPTGVNYNCASIYAPALDAVILFADDTGGTYKIAPGPVVTTLGNTPSFTGWYPLRNHAVASPSGDALILECVTPFTSSRVWKLVGSTWTLQAYTHPFLTSFNTAVDKTYKMATLANAIWCFGNNGGSAVTRLWRPE